MIGYANIKRICQGMSGCVRMFKREVCNQRYSMAGVRIYLYKRGLYRERRGSGQQEQIVGGGFRVLRFWGFGVKSK